MKIILIRHGKVCYKWRGLVTSEGFNQACIGYDNGEIKIDEVPQRDLDIDLIYISGLQRTYDTANILFPGRVYVKNDIFNEVPGKDAESVAFVFYCASFLLSYYFPILHYT